jgi:serine/threonine-protein kinase HipA
MITPATMRHFAQKWQAICDEAALSEVDQALFWRRQFLNPFAFLNAPDGVHVPLSS